MDIAGEPRSVAEMEFVAGMHACEGCGDARTLEWRVGGQGSRWVLRATCPRCATPRELVFHSARDLIAVAHPSLELGGPEPSAIMAPADLLGEIDRLAPGVARDPSTLDGEAWHANAAIVDRVLTALHELDKFVPADAGSIPPTGQADELLRPERYSRAWIRDQIVQWEVTAAEIAGDAPRIFAADPMLTRATPARGSFDAAALGAHSAWLARGKWGEGQLDVVVSDADGFAGEGADLADAKLEAVRLRHADLRSARFDDAALVDVDLRGAQLDAATFTGARLRGCTLDGAELDAATLDRARVETCVLESASLVRTRWRAAHATATSFRNARFVHAQLDRARFIDCDFRGASFGALAAGAVFERCDFRGASLEGCDLMNAHLVHCKVAGAYGAPAATDGLSVVYADFSDAGDGSDLGDLEDLLDQLAD